MAPRVKVLEGLYPRQYVDTSSFISSFSPCTEHVLIWSSSSNCHPSHLTRPHRRFRCICEPTYQLGLQPSQHDRGFSSSLSLRAAFPCSPPFQIPSLSIVVGLMLVFRNQTAYSRFWNGRLHVNSVTTAIRCLARQILVLVPAPAVPPSMQSMNSESYLDAPGSRTPMSYYEAVATPGDDVLGKADEARTIETVRILIAMLYTIKNHLRAEWGVALSPGTRLTEDGQEDIVDEYKDLLPPQMKGYEHRGLGLTLQLSTFIEDFVQYGVEKYVSSSHRLTLFPLILKPFTYSQCSPHTGNGSTTPPPQPCSPP